MFAEEAQDAAATAASGAAAAAAAGLADSYDDVDGYYNLQVCRRRRHLPRLRSAPGIARAGVQSSVFHSVKTAESYSAAKLSRWRQRCTSSCLCTALPCVRPKRCIQGWYSDARVWSFGRQMLERIPYSSSRRCSACPPGTSSR